MPEDSRPVPDPTLLTTEALNREVGQLEARLTRQLVEVDHRLAVEGVALRKEIQDAIENAKSERHNILNLTREKFRGVKTQLKLWEAQRLEQKADTKTAVDAALQAQKEAVREQTIASGLSIAKSETATTKQLDQLNASFQSQFTAQGRVIDDLKERVVRAESRAGATMEGEAKQVTQRQESRSGVGLWIAIAGTVIFGLGFVVSLVALVVTLKP